MADQYSVISKASKMSKFQSELDNSRVWTQLCNDLWTARQPVSLSSGGINNCSVVW